MEEKKNLSVFTAALIGAWKLVASYNNISQIYYIICKFYIIGMAIITLLRKALHYIIRRFLLCWEIFALSGSTSVLSCKKCFLLYIFPLMPQCFTVLV